MGKKPKKDLYVIGAIETTIGPDTYVDNYGRTVKPTLVKMVIKLFNELHDEHIRERHEHICKEAPPEANAYVLKRYHDEHQEMVTRKKGLPTIIAYVKIPKIEYH
tara:strand:+ start:276 stop:590 length:315 start_codon:yes stop_codon:yes gene_type:complete